MADIRRPNRMDDPANRAHTIADLRKLADELDRADVSTAFVFVTCRPLPPEECEGDKVALMAGHVWGADESVIAMAGQVSEIAMRTILEHRGPFAGGGDES